MSVERLLKSLHSWLGIMILPWVFIAGFTGLYMNHDRLMLSVLPDTKALLSDVPPDAQPIGQDAAADRAALYLDQWDSEDDARRDGIDTYRFQSDAVTVDVARNSGAVLVQSRYVRSLYAADGSRLATEVRWGRVLSSLHQRGWVGSGLGVWLADIAAVALMVFAVSGMWLFTAPRLRRMRNRRARLAAQRAAA